MKKVILQFPSIIQLVDFTVFIESEKFEINRTQLTIVGEFSQAEIELAKHAYNATEEIFVS